MNLNALRSLEFDKIRARLAEHTAFAASRELALALEPSDNAEEVARHLQETTEARALLDQRPTFGIGGARDVRVHTHNARIGARLTPTEFLDLRGTLLSARSIRRALAPVAETYPRLAFLAQSLADLPALVDEITRTINDDAEVADGASPELERIRRELKIAHARLMDRLQKILTSPVYAKVLQEPIITEREGRYVIPVRAEAKGRLPGLVHDASASGATVFVEPLAVVELGNRVRELQKLEEHEVERILRELTARVAENAEAIDGTVEILADIDLAIAKAHYAAEINAVAPELGNSKFVIRNSKFEIQNSQSEIRNPKSEIDSPQSAICNLKSPSSNLQSLLLLDARHPLLDPEKVVPITVRLGEDFQILVITGPNTGGKTVSLKTVGLLALMAQAGMHIPAKTGSRLPVYRGVYADIGDEQSIEQSLSTFSSHLKNIVAILREADSHSLVLLDELGAGTDPVEGAALARAILAHLLERKIPALVATHYAELKAFAHSTPGVQNASMEFDLETLSPTFHLTIGLPGRSNAFAIAARLGLAARIVERAKSWLTRADVEIETLLAEIKKAKEDAERERNRAELAHREAQVAAAEARRKLADVEKSRAEILSRAREEALADVREARVDLQRLRDEWRGAKPTREFVEHASAQLDAVEEFLPEPPPKKSAPPAPGEKIPFGIGDRVRITTLGQTGSLVGLDDESAEVQIGAFRMRVAREELERVEAAEPRREAAVKVPEVESPGMELHLRGLRADDALVKLEDYLDRAYLAGLPQVRIVHGKGTGALRKLVREALAEHPLVAEVKQVEESEGGEGVTVARLVSR